LFVMTVTFVPWVFWTGLQRKVGLVTMVGNWFGPNWSSRATSWVMSGPEAE
jgi:hypothetical protein